MKRFCIITNREKDGSMEVTNRIAAFLENRGGKIYLAGEEYRGGGARYTRAEDIPEDTQCALVLGGDGTILQAAHDLAARQIPIFGINLGTLGFLAETEVAELDAALSKLLSGEYTVKEQMMLAVTVHAEGRRSALPESLTNLTIHPARRTLI